MKSSFRKLIISKVKIIHLTFFSHRVITNSLFFFLVDTIINYNVENLAIAFFFSLCFFVCFELDAVYKSVGK